MLPNPLNSNETYVFSREEYALIRIRCGMFVMKLRAEVKFNIMHIQMHQITILLMDQRLSILNGLHFARQTSFEFINTAPWSDVSWAFIYVPV